MEPLRREFIKVAFGGRLRMETEGGTDRGVIMLRMINF